MAKRERPVTNVWKFTNDGGQTFIFAEIGRGQRGYTMTIGMEGDQEAEDLLRAFNDGIRLTERDAEIARSGKDPVPERQYPKDIVIFRKYPDGTPVAIFPEIPADVDGSLCVAYMYSPLPEESLRQDAASCTIVMRETEPLPRGESKAIKKSLEYLGYNLEVKSDTTPEMLHRRRVEATRRQASPAFQELEMARNLFGGLSPDIRRRLEAAIENPTEETWDDAHTIILNPHEGMGLTLWQAVIAIDPSFPQSGPSTDYRGRRVSGWPQIPSRDLLLAALRYATH